MSMRWDLLDACMAALGGEDFIAPFLDLLRELGSDQVMVFAYTGDHASCLLSWNFTQSQLGSRLAADYLDGWYRQDPLCARVLAAKPRTVELCRLGDVLPLMAPDYRERFFTRPGIEHKDAVLAAGEARRLILNLYRYDKTSVAPAADALRFAGRLALLHFESSSAASYPPPLAALSDREREVCLGVLSGKKTETIAGEIGVAPSTVTTYRRRAYEKLGISSRAALFAICRA